MLNGLEERSLLAIAPVLSALTTYHYWVDYAPSYQSPGDSYNPDPTDIQITADLTNLYREGFRGLVTYTLLGSYADIPKLAKSVGFLWVIAGIYDPTNATEVDTAASPNVLPYADAFVVGNEGLTDGRYTPAELTTGINEVKQTTGKPVTTSEPGGAYYTPNGPNAPYATQLLSLGDWLLPNIDYFLWGGQPSTPQFMWMNVSFVYQFMLANQTTPGPVVAKEIAYPSAGGPEASDANQISWYHDYAARNLVAGEPFSFVYFEAYDQPWKSSINAYEPHMGLNAINNPDGSSQPKPSATQLQADIMSAYPGTNVPPYAGKQGLALTEAPGVPFTANLAEVTDPNDPIGSSNDLYSASLLWGDGAGAQAANVSISNGTVIVSASHTYHAAGQYTVQVALQRSSGYGEVVQTEATVVAPDLAVLQFSSGHFIANVTAGSGQIVLARAGDLSASVTVVLSSPGGHEVAPFSEMVNLAPGAQSKIVTVPIVNDRKPGESNTVIPLSLSAPGPGATLGVTASAALIIVDNNPLPRPVTITSLQTPTIKVGTGRKAKLEAVIRLRFSGPVNGAGNLRAYLLQLGKTVKGVVNFTKTVGLTMAQYNASTHTVDLIPKIKLNLSAPERLIVTAALITDAFGRPLDGNDDGRPGGNFVAVFSKNGVRIDGTARSVGLTR
jgi:exo-beta-1,3-glucanase (GH17 family)